MSTRGKLLAAYLGSDDPASKFTDYYPEWLNHLADDVTLQGSLLDGVVRGRESVRTIVLAIRSLYDRQEFYFVSEVGDNGFVEDYVSAVSGEPIGCIVLIRYNTKVRSSTSRRATVRAARYCYYGGGAKNLPEPRMPITSLPANRVNRCAGTPRHPAVEKRRSQ